MEAVGKQRVGLLVRGQFDSGDFAMFTGLGNVTYGGVTYTGAGQCLQVGDTTGDTTDGSSGLAVTLSGIDAEIISLAELEEFQRRRVTVYLALFDDEGQLTEADVFFDGLADDMESNDDPASPEVTLACEQRALDLSRPRPFRYLPEDQKKRFAGDTFFDLVQTIQNRDDTWAK
ncbi:hypothetical protein [Candidatus Halocynthiibacter alkanivorans]|uniref:hypothetical protein n=1 Tax=Candidatus Halocynthiibacter alkanivorans TaxID=2267619 RepID=UPI000DF14FFE|nr:hypothetical protein [Candidatus Halocynthiibacter alkanivorans]